MRLAPGSATTAGVTRGAVQSAGDAASGPASAATTDGWTDVRADDSIQYAPVDVPRPEPPDLGWLEDLAKWLGDLFSPAGQALGGSWPVLKWVLIAATVAALLFLLWRLLAPVLERAPRPGEGQDDWAPHHADALALLEEADRLAAEGRYDEATHLLLRRSVGQIAAARPDWVEPSSTARELAALPALPEAARAAFRVIAERVERSMFALRQLGRDDWDAARAAYAEFALQHLPGRAA